MALKLKSFAQPDLLKKIQHQNLIRLLEPHRLFFEMKGFSLPAGDDGKIEYLALAGVLAQPDEDMPSDLVEALHVIGNFSGDEHFNDLLELAQREALDVAADATTPDLATQIYLRDSQILERKDREQVFEKRKTFESYRAANPESVVAVDDLPTDLLPLEAALDKYFQSKKQGVGCPGHPKRLRPGRSGSWCSTGKHANASRAVRESYPPVRSSDGEGRRCDPRRSPQ